MGQSWRMEHAVLQNQHSIVWVTLIPFYSLVWGLAKPSLSDNLSEKYMGKLCIYLEWLFGLTCMGTALLLSSRAVLFCSVGLNLSSGHNVVFTA